MSSNPHDLNPGCAEYWKTLRVNQFNKKMLSGKTSARKLDAQGRRQKPAEPASIRNAIDAASVTNIKTKADWEANRFVA